MYYVTHTDRSTGDGESLIQAHITQVFMPCEGVIVYYHRLIFLSVLPSQ